MLIALMAPRPLLLQTGDSDLWADPKGEFLAAKAAGPVYQLLGQSVPEAEEFPPAGIPLLSRLGYTMHAGDHGTLPEDYAVFIRYMKKHFSETSLPPNSARGSWLPTTK